MAKKTCFCFTPPKNEGLENLKIEIYTSTLQWVVGKNPKGWVAIHSTPYHPLSTPAGGSRYIFYIFPKFSSISCDISLCIIPGIFLYVLVHVKR